MARYGFTGSMGNLGAGGGRWNLGLGRALQGGLNAGFDFIDQWRDMENRGITDQFRVPAQAAGYDAARLSGANEAMRQAAGAAELSSLAGQMPIEEAQAFPQVIGSQGIAPGQMGLGAALNMPQQMPMQPQQSPANLQRFFQAQQAYPLGPFYMSQ